MNLHFIVIYTKKKNCEYSGTVSYIRATSMHWRPKLVDSNKSYLTVFTKVKEHKFKENLDGINPKNWSLKFQVNGNIKFSRRVFSTS